jgi:cell division protein FtsW
MSFSREDRSRLAGWWFTIDHVLLIAILILVGAGLVFSLAASPSVALKKGLPAYYFVERHVIFSALGALILVVLSFLTTRETRRVALVLLFVALAGLVAVHFTGKEINGARRWLSLAGHSLQPSEFLKPAFVVISAWLLAEARTRPEMPGLWLAVGLYAIVASFLVLQPDVGQTLLLSLVWGALFFVSGQPLAYAAAVLLLGLVAIVGAYFTFPHVESRIDRFLDPAPGDNSQVDRALQSFTQGGFFGRGPGEGTIKTSLPDAHTDFIFAVIAEEYGAIACLAIVLLFGFIVLRALYRAGQEPDLVIKLGIIGLALVFGLQALINMGVNVGLLPAKGITLPYLSAGGSSTLAISITLGMLLALTRRRAA